MYTAWHRQRKQPRFSSRALTLELLEDRSLLSFIAPVGYDAGLRPGAVATADLNGDGNVDIVTANTAGGDVSVLLGNGDGTFQAPVHYRVGQVPSTVLIGDFNGDGKLDILTANPYSGDVSFLAGNGDGTFQAAQNSPAGEFPCPQPRVISPAATMTLWLPTPAMTG